MPISRRLVAQDTISNQYLKVDHSSRYIVNMSIDWQMLFGPNSSLSSSNQIIKISAQFDAGSFDNLKVTAYLFDQRNGSIANAANCSFKIFKITDPDWSETLLTTLSGTQLPNYYYYIHPTLSTFVGLDFLGGDSIMIEATIVRLGVTYRDRVYINHLGIYDNVFRLRQDVEFLDATKLDE